MDSIRAFAVEDVPGVADLFQKVFRRRQAPAPLSLRHCVGDLYFSHPWRDDRCSSLVYETDKGTVAGFLGALPLRLHWRDQSLLAAVAGNFMVDPALCNPMVGARLFRAFLQHGQDITISDTANGISRRMWETAGGVTCMNQGLQWIRPLRPSQMALRILARRRAGRLLLPVLRYPAKAADGALATLVHGWPPSVPEGCVQSDLSLPELLDVLLESGQQYSLRPEYDRCSLEWRMRHAQEKTQYGRLHRQAVRNAEGQILGWFMYYGRQGAVARVLQFGAIPPAMPMVVDSLVYHAWCLGATGLEARVSVDNLVALARRGGLLRECRPYVVAHAQNPEIMDALARGDILFSRLEGEWWTRLAGDKFN